MVTGNASSSSSKSVQLCAADHVTAAAAAAATGRCHDNVYAVTSLAHPWVLPVFVVAQLLVGLGGCGILVLTFPYIDENSPHTKSALYLGTC